MDIVHLIEAKIVQSTQDHSSHTYAEIEQSISQDHSEGNRNIHLRNTKIIQSPPKLLERQVQFIIFFAVD